MIVKFRFPSLCLERDFPALQRVKNRNWSSRFKRNTKHESHLSAVRVLITSVVTKEYLGNFVSWLQTNGIPGIISSPNCCVIIINFLDRGRDNSFNVTPHEQCFELGCSHFFAYRNIWNDVLDVHNVGTGLLYFVHSANRGTVRVQAVNRVYIQCARVFEIPFAEFKIRGGGNCEGTASRSSRKHSSLALRKREQMPK